MSTRYIPAGAGSGKTHKLTHDLADMLTREENPVEASRIILTTFTKSAAADFIRRAREVLITEKHAPAKAAELDGALIGTVHSICERFVKKYCYRLDLNLPLNVMSDADRKLFTSRTTENVASDEDVKYFAGFAREFDMEPDFWKECVEGIVEKRYSFDVGNLEESCRVSCEDIDKVFSVDVKLEDDGVFDVFFNRMIEVFAQENTKTAKDNERKSRDILRKSLFYKSKEIRSVIKLDEKPSIFKTEKNFKNSGYSFDELERVYALAGGYLISQEVGSRMKDCVKKLFRLACDWEREYEQFKADNSLLDYNDLEQKFLRILNEEDFEDVRKDISNSYQVMMVDEFQDSNPVQIKIFRKMMSLVQETVFVGDSKQAIYGFRGTESSLVEDFIKGIVDQKPLKKSYRSRKDLVLAANTIFCKAFGRQQLPVDPKDDTKPYDGVSLKEVRIEPEGMGPALQHWNTPEPKGNNSVKNDYAAVGKKIYELVVSKTCMVVRKDKNGHDMLDTLDYGDIAILLRNGYNIGEVADALRSSGVPVSILEEDFVSRAEVQLILALVRYIFNNKDEGARADILHLLGGVTSVEVIRGSALGQWGEEASLLFRRLEDIRSRVSVLSVSDIVDSLTLELDLYGNVKEWGMHSTRVRNIGFMADLARQYEEQCTNTNLAPTLPGFVSYVYGYKPEKRLVDKTNTVKILTYHNAKGLDWPMVILDELDSFKTDDQEVIRKEYNGVHNFRKAVNDEILLHLFPSILNKNSKKQSLPDVIVERIKTTDLFEYVKNRRVEEERRILYVGFTRAKDYLVTLGNPKSKYSWLTACGARCEKEEVQDGTAFKLWHSDYPSTLMDLPSPEKQTETQEEEKPRKAWTVPEEKDDYEKKFKSPSKHDDKATAIDARKVILTEVFKGEKMVQDIGGEENGTAGNDNRITLCGTCVHRIFAAYNPDGDQAEMVQMAKRIIEGMELTKEFHSPISVIESAAQLLGWLKHQYGEGTPLRELPFVMQETGGSVVRGEMDLIWELPGKKCVLVDYKSFHGDLRGIKAHAVLHGYPEQLKAYKETLEADGYTVQDALIYYFVLGRVIKFDVN